MNLEAIKAAAKQLLSEYYQLKAAELPQRREKSQWTTENRFGFFLGIIQYAEDFLVTELYNLLLQKDFERNEMAVMDKMYDFHIRVFKQHNGPGSSCHTPSDSSPFSESNSIMDLVNVPEESEKKLRHLDLKSTVVQRDGVCLFCWSKFQCQGAHIVAQKDVPFLYDEPSLFQRTGLKQKHQVQNGLLLCALCHREFDGLKRFVDVVDDMLVVKVVNETNDETNLDWIAKVKSIEALRRTGQEIFVEFKSREVVTSNGEMVLYFINSTPLILPNREALKFHKAACLIWRMAGGAEPEEEYCPDCDDEHLAVDYRLKDIQKWREDSRSAMLNTEVNK
jgi:hypothetical protein